MVDWRLAARRNPLDRVRQFDHEHRQHQFYNRSGEHDEQRAREHYHKHNGHEHIQQRAGERYDQCRTQHYYKHNGQRHRSQHNTDHDDEHGRNHQQRDPDDDRERSGGDRFARHEDGDADLAQCQALRHRAGQFQGDLSRQRDARG
ncbi:MAG: hypothetical protein ACTHMP_11870, partial [Thermomicrobiales bacterium]